MQPRKKLSSTSEAARGARRPAEPKQRNVTRACQQCRRRKSKCDGGQPTCSTCSLYHDECSYSAEQDGRRPAARAYVTALEDRIRVLEGLLKQRDDAGMQDLGDSSSTATDEDGEGKAIGLDRLKLDEETSEFLAYGPTSAFQHLPTASPPPNSTMLATSPTSSFADLEHRPSLGGESASLHTALSPPPLPEVPTGPFDWNKNLPDDLDGWDEELHDELLERFFLYFNGWCLFVHEGAFRRDMACCLAKSVPSPPIRLSNYSPLLHCAILAIACSFKDDPRLADGTSSEKLAKKAKAAMEDEAERPMLSALRGLLLLGSWHTGAAKIGLAYVYAGIAIRMSQTLGLGIDATTLVRRGVITEAMRQGRDNTLWLSFIQDKLWSSYVGRAPTLLRNTLETALPVIDPDLDRQPFVPLLADVQPGTLSKPVPSMISSAFHYTCRIAVIEEKVMSIIYGLRSPHYSASVLNRVSELALELETWSSSLPVELRIAPQVTKPPAPAVILLSCFFHFVMILLHRPYYSRFNTGSNLPINDVAIKRANASATRIVSLLELYHRCPGLRFAPIATMQIAFAAGTTHLLALVNAESSDQPKAAERAREAAMSCVWALREMGKAWKCASGTAQILEGLIEKYSPERKQASSPVVETPALEQKGEEAATTDEAAQASLAQALDPNSLLAKTLRSLGWTPPVASSSTSSQTPQGPTPTPQAPPFSAAFSAPPPSSGMPFSGPTDFQGHGGAPDLYGVRFWPFFDPGYGAAPATATGAGASGSGAGGFSAPQAYPIADDVLGGLLCTEGRPAADAVYHQNGQFDWGSGGGGAGSALFGGAQEASVFPPGWLESLGEYTAP
ncbi:hypothetical protein JCM10207_005747 [Rhodosporidiobolus poonsookiae]